MAYLSIYAENNSPLVSYAPSNAWIDTVPNTLNASSGQSSHTTNQTGATASITFNGTGITLYGANMPGYGKYQFSVDGSVVKTGDASSNTPVYNQTLGSVSNLPEGQHTAVLTAEGSGTIDFDWFEFALNIGTAGTVAVNNTIDDSNTLTFFYGPDGSSWSEIDNPTFIDGTLHFSQDPAAQVFASFEGDAIAVYGTVGQDHADIIISIDGQNTTIPLSANEGNSLAHPSQLLFFASGLGPDSHSFSMTCVSNNTIDSMDLDAVIVYSTVPSNGTNTTPSGGNSNATVQSKKLLGRDAMIGLIVGGAAVVLLVLLLILALIYRRRRVRWGHQRMEEPATPTLPIQNPNMMEKGYGPQSRFSNYEDEGR